MIKAGNDVDEVADVAARALSVGLKRIQIFTWRDLESPEAGGSELHADKVASIWARSGLDVTLVTGASAGLPPTTSRHDYRVVRRGGPVSVFPRAALSAFSRPGARPDGLVEVWHGMPFFSPLWARCPRIAFVHHVHDDVWHDLLPGPMARVGRFMEMKVAPVLYRRCRLVTPSGSGRDDLVSMLGMDPAQVTVVPNGVDPRFHPGGARAAKPTVVAVGRLTAIKRFDLLIDAVVEARRAVPELEATIIGEGPERAALEARISRAGAHRYVELTGFVSDDALVEAYRRAWVVASTSSREGWNMTITEAAACGTPAVATDAVGHRDSLWHDVSGLLSEAGGPFTAALVRVLCDEDLRRRLSQGALRRASVLTWEATAAGVLDALADEVERRRRRRR